MKKRIRDLRAKCDGAIRRWCGAMSPDKRVITTVALCAVFGIANIYVVVRAIYEIGKENARQEIIKIEHLKQLEIEKDERVPDLINKLIEEENEQK